MLQPDSGYLVLSFNAATCRAGDVTLNGKKHHVVVLDFNSNGRFDDAARLDESAETP